jgi:hypothetical protein
MNFLAPTVASAAPDETDPRALRQAQRAQRPTSEARRRLRIVGRGVAAQDAFNARYAQSGELLAAYGLGDELTVKTIWVREGAPAVTDGPYIEAKEFVSSFCLFDCESEKRALQLAAEMPFASYNAVEVSAHHPARCLQPLCKHRANRQSTHRP